MRTTRMDTIFRRSLPPAVSRHFERRKSGVEHTNGVRTNGICVHSEQRNSDERSVPPEAKYSITQLESSLMLIGIALMEIYV